MHFTLDSLKMAPRPICVIAKFNIHTKKTMGKIFEISKYFFYMKKRND